MARDTAREDGWTVGVGREGQGKQIQHTAVNDHNFQSPTSAPRLIHKMYILHPIPAPHQCLPCLSPTRPSFFSAISRQSSVCSPPDSNFSFSRAPDPYQGNVIHAYDQVVATANKLVKIAKVRPQPTKYYQNELTRPQLHGCEVVATTQNARGILHLNF